MTVAEAGHVFMAMANASQVIRTRTTRIRVIYGRSVVSISSLANGAYGEHRRHDSDGIRLEIDAPGWRSSVRRSTDPTPRHAGQ